MFQLLFAKKENEVYLTYAQIPLDWNDNFELCTLKEIFWKGDQQLYFRNFSMGHRTISERVSIDWILFPKIDVINRDASNLKLLFLANCPCK
ncbi:hypothetical protein KUH03_04310 [Sphingobacterium sp. E70]|uniref:hypothetical protein n=1 Tax=Sphingobacterium sp. E70 TaxID=2853439 RepID=UPI00211C3379|nr:hypothetical protein [Sphingobacterium sp. E70]ULT26165.1 hypothetical protein KUH03_04310 [Sphingobacterium sp. E70]